VLVRVLLLEGFVDLTVVDTFHAKCTFPFTSQAVTFSYLLHNQPTLALIPLTTKQHHNTKDFQKPHIAESHAPQPITKDSSSTDFGPRIRHQRRNHEYRPACNLSNRSDGLTHPTKNFPEPTSRASRPHLRARLMLQAVSGCLRWSFSSFGVRRPKRPRDYCKSRVPVQCPLSWVFRHLQWAHRRLYDYHHCHNAHRHQLE
jgi:hypothetical protein